jgi:hypothetical protein
MGPYPASLPSQPMKQWGQSQAFISSWLLGLLDPYHQYAIGMFNTCSQVPTPRSLTDTGRGYHIENLRIATTLSPPFHSEGSTDPPNWPRSVSTFNQVLTTKPKFLSFKEPMAATWSFDHSAIYRSLHLRLAISNDLSLVMGS